MPIAPKEWTESRCQSPVSLELGEDDVHAWRVPLDQSHDVVHMLAATLSADERLRAAWLRAPRDRQWFVVGRAVLRAILGRCTGMCPRELVFKYGPSGKPFVAPSSGVPAVSFSMSRSGPVAVYAVARARPLGIDVERIRAVPELDEVERLLATRERSRLAQSNGERLAAFFLDWTRLEALAKARGRGIAEELESEDGPGTTSDASSWTLRVLVPEQGYVTTLAVAGSDFRLACWDALGA